MIIITNHFMNFSLQVQQYSILRKNIDEYLIKNCPLLPYITVNLNHVCYNLPEIQAEMVIEKGLAVLLCGFTLLMLIFSESPDHQAFAVMYSVGGKQIFLL